MNSTLQLKLKAATQSFNILHLSDVHLCECDDRDHAAMDFIRKQRQCWGDSRSEFEKLIQFANTEAIDFVAFTGDIIEIPTAANLELLQDFLKQLHMPFAYAMGNHEWYDLSTDHHDYWQEQMQSVTLHPMDVHVVELYGVSLLFVDNSNYQISAKQLAFVQDNIGACKPCFIFMHLPLGMPGLRAETIKTFKRPMAMADTGWSLDERALSGIEGESEWPSTLAFCDFIKNRTGHTSVFAGHAHLDHRGFYADGIQQFVVTPGFRGGKRVINVTIEDADE